MRGGWSVTTRAHDGEGAFGKGTAPHGDESRVPQIAALWNLRDGAPRHELRLEPRAKGYGARVRVIAHDARGELAAHEEAQPQAARQWQPHARQHGEGIARGARAIGLPACRERHVTEQDGSRLAEPRQAHVEQADLDAREGERRGRAVPALALVVRPGLRRGG